MAKKRSKIAPARTKKQKSRRVNVTLNQDGAVPVWSQEVRELRLGDQILKCFRQPARNQEMILASFQEEGWPPHIDDPLPGGDNVDSPERLHNAVKRLNDQVVHRIRFLSDGKGQGILWELREPGAD